MAAPRGQNTRPKPGGRLYIHAPSEPDQRWERRPVPQPDHAVSTGCERLDLGDLDPQAVSHQRADLSSFEPEPVEDPRQGAEYHVGKLCEHRALGAVEQLSNHL